MRVVGLNDEALGVMSLQEALSISRKLETDLIEICPHSIPPVCRLMDYGKFKYQQQKKQQKERLNQKVGQVKEVKLTPNIAQEDYDTKLRRTCDLVSKGNPVKVVIRFRGREVVHKDKGLELLEKFVSQLAEQKAVEFVKKEEERCVSALVSLNRKTKSTN